MNETSETSPLATLTAMHNTTFSQALAAGLTHSGWLDGPTATLCGQAVALVSHSVPLEKAVELTTRATCGPRSVGSSPSVGHRLSLASRLEASLPKGGLSEYTMTWRRSVIEFPTTSSGTTRLTLYRLAASGRRTSGNGCGGWPTPKVATGDYQMSNGRKCWNLSGVAKMAGWPTPLGVPQSKASHGQLCGAYRDKVKKLLAGWRTPSSSDGEGGIMDVMRAKREKLSPKIKLRDQAHLAGWLTPKCPSGGGQAERTTPGGGLRKLEDQALGVTSPSSPVPTGKPGALAPAFSLWLMGFRSTWVGHAPYWKEWDTVQRTFAEYCGDQEAFSHWLVNIGLEYCGERVTRSAPKRRPSS